MESILLELKNLISNYTNKPNFTFLKVFCLITWAAFVFKLTVIPIWLVIIPFCLIFLSIIISNYIRLVKAYKAQLPKNSQQNIKGTASVPEMPKEIKTNTTISTNI